MPRLTLHKHDRSYTLAQGHVVEHCLYDNDEPTGWFVEECYTKKGGKRKEIRLRYLKRVTVVLESGKNKGKEADRIVTTTKKAKARTPKAACKELIHGYKNRKKINRDLMTLDELKKWRRK